MYPNRTPLPSRLSGQGPERPAVRKLRELLEEQGMAKGIAAGMAAGRAEGMAAGREEGMAAGRAEGVAAGRALGILEGKQESLLLVFSERGLPTTPKERDRIVACTNFDQLSRWLRRAVTAGSVAEVLADRPSGKTAAPRARHARPKSSRPASG